MLFNSGEFVFAFLPAAVIGFFLFGAVGQRWALLWLIGVSIFFYAWWRPLNVLIIAPSILINFGFARTIERLNASGARPEVLRLVLALGIGFNIAFLGFFKYVDFLSGSINDVFGTNLVLLHVILPLGISFITFQKIAFLVDVYSKRVVRFTFRDYCLFVLFFPQLISGPIVHYREMMPQFQAASCRPNREDLAVGLTLFFFGLFKKVVLADNIAPLTSEIYEQAGAAGGTSLLRAWAAALGFTLQIYFDFSGYSDMALGIARLFGIRLPQNFDSPLRATSIIDFWARWHMTLTRFLTAYVYNPMVLWLTRRRLAKHRDLRVTTLNAFLYLLAFPTLLTMFLSGLWHGAGYGFILWGLLHGVFLTVNQAWRRFGAQLVPAAMRDALRPLQFTAFVLTFMSVVVGMVLFRSPTIPTAVDIFKGMIGLNGIGLPGDILDKLGPVTHWLVASGVVREEWSRANLTILVFWLPVLLFIALACPNTMQILSRFEPALGVRRRTRSISILEWRPSLAWAIGVAAIAAVSVGSLRGATEFLYWQF